MSGGSSVKPTRRNAPVRAGVRAPVVVERPHAPPLLEQQVEIDVGHRPPVAVREALGLGEQHAVLVDRRLAVPRQVGRRLALAGRGVDVGGQAAGGRRPAQQLAVLGPPDRDRAAGQVEEHRRARERRLGARRDGDPHVLADLDVDDEPGDVVGGEQQVRAERHVGAADADLAALADARGELPPLVELAVGGRIGLRDHAEHAAAVDDDRAVVDRGCGAAAARRRRSAAGDPRCPRPPWPASARRRRAPRPGAQVLERVARQRHLREQRHRDALLGALPGRPEHQLAFTGGSAIATRPVHAATRAKPCW